MLTSSSPFVSCPSVCTQESRPPNTQPDPCQFPDLVSNISIDQEATHTSIFVREAESTLDIQQRAPGFWSLDAESTIPVTQSGDRLRVVFGDADTLLTLNQSDTVAGGRLPCDCTGGGTGNTQVYNDFHEATNGSPTINLSNTNLVTGAERIYLNGLRQRSGATHDYTINYGTGVVTFNFNLVNDVTGTDVVCADYEIP